MTDIESERSGRILETMLSLTRTAPLHRVIVAGDKRMDFYLALRRRGFIRVTTPEICRIARAQHSIGLIAGQSSSLGTEAVLDRISPFLAENAGLALLIGSREDAFKVRPKLEALGFHIEAGVRHGSSLVLSATRQGHIRKANAA